MYDNHMIELYFFMIDDIIYIICMIHLWCHNFSDITMILMISHQELICDAWQRASGPRSRCTHGMRMLGSCILAYATRYTRTSRVCMMGPPSCRARWPRRQRDLLRLGSVAETNQHVSGCAICVKVVCWWCSECFSIPYNELLHECRCFLERALGFKGWSKVHTRPLTIVFTMLKKYGPGRFGRDSRMLHTTFQ